MTPPTVQPMTDAEKLRRLADWFDAHDRANGNTGRDEVQRDLRRIAGLLSVGPPGAGAPEPSEQLMAMIGSATTILAQHGPKGLAAAADAASRAGAKNNAMLIRHAAEMLSLLARGGAGASGAAPQRTVIVGDLPSVNLRNGIAYTYCPECGTEQWPAGARPTPDPEAP